jgi:hypothetical protein
MPFPIVGCGPQPFTTWLFAAAIGVVVLALETGTLVVLTRRHAWDGSIVLAVATLVAAGLTLALGMHANQYTSDMFPHMVGCDVNGSFLVTAADSTAVLDAYRVAGQLFGAIMGLLLFGSLITLVSLFCNKTSARRTSQD